MFEIKGVLTLSLRTIACMGLTRLTAACDRSMCSVVHKELYSLQLQVSSMPSVLGNCDLHELELVMLGSMTTIHTPPDRAPW